MLEFLPESHCYLLNGIITPSVTTLIRWELGEEYASVDAAVLARAADYGNWVHEVIEEYELTKAYPLDPDEVEIVNKAVSNHPDIKVIEVEKMLANEHIAGTLDMLCEDGTVIDIKTTYKYNEEYLKWQIGLYNLLLGQEKDGLCLYIPRRNKKAQWKPVKPHTNAECRDLIDRYEKAHQEEMEEVPFA